MKSVAVRLVSNRVLARSLANLCASSFARSEELGRRLLNTPNRHSPLGRRLGAADGVYSAYCEASDGANAPGGPRASFRRLI